jgi:hypothetical protein
MSSKMDSTRRLEACLVLAASILCTLWYAKGQLLFTLYFGYQVLQFLIPQWFPQVGAAG